MTPQELATLSNGILNEAKSEGRVDILEKNLAVKNMLRLNRYWTCKMGNTWNTQYY